MVHTAHILVGGGTGFVGRHLVRLLRGAGAKVRVITRKPGSNADNLSWMKIKSDGLPKETTAVVNVAGRNILDPVVWSEAFKKEVYDSRVETNKILVDAIHKSPDLVKSYVSVSGVGYYGPTDPPTEDDNFEFDENWTQPDSLPAAANYLMRLARDWEKSSELDESKAPHTRRVVIRSGVVIGSGGGLIKNMKLPFSLGVGATLGSGNQWFPWIHIDDLANMFKFAITNNHVTGIINGVAPEQVKNKDFTAIFARSLNRPAFFTIPEFAIRLGLAGDRADIMLKGVRVKSRSGLLGFRYDYPSLRSACDESVGKN